MPRHFLLLIWILWLYMPIVSCSQNDQDQKTDSDLPQQISTHPGTHPDQSTPADMSREIESLRMATADLSQENRKIFSRQSKVEANLNRLVKMMKGKDSHGENPVALANLQEAEDFLLKARASEKTNPRLAELYYLAGISRLPDKKRGLDLFFAWMEKRVILDLDKKNYHAATTKIDQLSRVLDDNFYPDQIESVPAYAQFYQRLDKLSKKIFQHKTQVTKNQIIRLSNIEKSIAQFDYRNIKQYELAYKKISTMHPESEDIQKRARILLSRLDLLIKASRACSFIETDNLIFPPEEIPEALGPWLSNILNYMQNKQVPLNKRMKAWGEVSYLLSGLDYSRTPELAQQTRAIETAGRHLQAAGWIERCSLFERQHLKTRNLSKQQLSDAFLLLQEGTGHFRSHPDLIRPVIKKFGAGYFEGLKNNIAMNCQELYNSSFEAPVKIQINAAFLSQSFQVYLELKNFIKTYGNDQALLATQEKIKKLISGLTTYDESQRAIIAANERKKLKLTEQKFMTYARKNIDTAWHIFKEAEKSANKLTETWGDKDNQNSLKKGLSALYAIDRNSLNLVDPGLMDEWRRVEWLLKKEYKGRDEAAAEIIYARTKKKRLEDFE